MSLFPIRITRAMFNARTHHSFLPFEKTPLTKLLQKQILKRATRDIFPRKGCYKTICADMEARLLSRVRRVTLKYKEILLTNGCRLFDCICNYRVVTDNWTCRATITCCRFGEGAINRLARNKEMTYSLNHFWYIKIYKIIIITIYA